MRSFCRGPTGFLVMSSFLMKRGIALILLFLLFALPCNAEDKNGVSSNTISLPSGPGSIEGLGEAFQPMLNTGTAKYGINIALPPGTAGHSPTLSLNYESGHGDGPAGLGWRFGPGDIHRQTDKGIPRYVDGPNGVDDDHDGAVDEADELDRFIGVEDEELVALADGTYRARIEGAFIRYRRVGDHWEADLKDGTLLEFGVTPQGRVTDVDGTKTFRWLLEKSTDTNGNLIEFDYAVFPGSDNQKYLKQIRYGPGVSPWSAFYFAYLIYEDRSDWRKDYRSGFLVKTAKRLAQIDVGVQGVLPDQCAEGDWNQDGLPDALIRRYALSYNPDHFRSFLTKVTRYGANAASYLPSTSFSYSVFDPDPIVSATDAVITSSTAPTSVMDSNLVELVDLNRDGLPDLFQTDFHGGGQTYYQNLGVNTDGVNREIEWEDGLAVTSPYDQAGALHLVDEKVYLADMDGDGISDLIHAPYSQEVYYFLNQGDGSWGERKRMSIQDTAPPAPFTDDDVKTSDLDFDKRMDVVQSTDAGYSVWFNLEEGKYSRKVQTGGAVYRGDVIRFSEAGVHLEDLNGDRMNDVARIRPTHVVYCAAMGHGKFDSAVEIWIPDETLTDGSNGQVERADLKDVNGDGLADLVLDRAEVNQLWYWLNRGTDTFSGKFVITDMPNPVSPNTVVRWADINGNGTTDIIYADSTAEPRLTAIDIGELTAGTAHINLLTGIDNGLGVRTEISYRSNTEYYTEAREAGLPWTITVPFPVSVIFEVRTTSGLDLDMVPGVDEYVKTYSYRDGFYEDREKAFRGFAEVTVTESGDVTAPTSVTTHRFFTGGPDGLDNDGDGAVDEVSPTWHREEDALKGMVKAVGVRAEDGFLFSEEENDWQVKNLAVSTDNIEVRFAYSREVQTLIYEGTASPETLRTAFVYDEFGNVTAERNYGALSITGDETFTFTEYINDTNFWLLGVPQRQHTTDEALQIFSETRNYYDGTNYVGLSMGQVTAGNLMRQEGWVEGATYVNLVRNAYDGYGNVTGILDPNGNQRTVSYEGTFHTYPVQEEIEVGGGRPDLSVIAAYNLGLGVIVSSTGFNGHETTYGYDTFGRLTSVIRPGDTAAFPTVKYSYSIADPNRELVYDYDAEGVLTLSSASARPSSVSTRAREISGQMGTFDTVQYVDGMGRKLSSVEEGETGFVVKEAVLFNTKGTVQSSFVPYSASVRDYTPPIHGAPAIVTHYDATGREILHINPPDAYNVVSNVATAYTPLSTEITDENGNSKSAFYDGLDRLIEVHEQNQGETYVTQYSYDPLGNLLQITDPQSNVKTVEYDALSRKTAINDPDRGRTEYTYDSAGNLVQRVDNKGQTILYTYDGANRVLTEDLLDGNLFTPDVAYNYDTPSPDYPGAQNTKGLLASVEDLSGGVFFSYDARGNTLWSAKRIRDGAYTEDFVFMSQYDAMNRVTAGIFPDGDRVEYIYNSRSLLESIPGILDNMDYHPSGQLDELTYANGLTTAYSYDPRTRMTGLATDTTIPSGSPIQDLSYTFDGVSNITAITDNRAISPGAPENATQAFDYDDVYRLTRAEGSGYGAIDFDYDKIGNMVFKSSPDLPDPQHIDDGLINLGNMTSGGAAGTSGRGLRLPGDPPGPHAITSTASGLLFECDDNGNMTTHNGDVYEWDFKDRLVRTTTSETIAEYVYDYAGQRVIKKSQSNNDKKVVYYPGEDFEIRDGKPVKYIFDGRRRVARIEGRLAAGGETSWQVLSFNLGWNFFSLEVEPADPSIASVLAPIDGKYTEIWTFDAVSQQYRGYIVGEGTNALTELHAQQGYVIKVTGPSAFMVSGTRATNDIILESGWNLVSSPVDYPMAVIAALSSVGGKYAAVWTYEAQSASWKSFIAREIVATYDPQSASWNDAVFQPQEFLNTMNTMQPGKAYWIHMREPAQLAFHKGSQKIYYYHPDHLGSSSVVTDRSGVMVERTEFYPFGLLRHEQRDDFRTSYKFTGKERDDESGLDYFEARYYMPLIGRFISVDPFSEKWERKEDRPFPDPRIESIYSYANNNPLKYIDPDGRKIKLVFRDEEGRKHVGHRKAKFYYKKAKKYLSKSPYAAALFKRLEGHEETVTIVIEKYTQSTEYDWDKDTQEKTITWDAFSGYEVEEGKVQSAAIGLLHEVGHAVQHLDDPKKFLKEADEKQSPMGKWFVREEWRNIVHVETRIAKLLGEHTRKDYDSGKVVFTKGPTSTEKE